MYLVMNNFKIKSGYEEDFFNVWKSRDSHLTEVDGFIEFKFLRGKTTEEGTHFASHVFWESKEKFLAWTKSAEFKKAHEKSSESNHYFLGRAELICFEVLLSEK